MDASIKKAPIWFTSRGLQLPKLVQTIIDANSRIAQKDSSVNTEFMVKVHAVAHIDELVEISKKQGKPRNDKKNHDFAKDGFTYRNVFLRIMMASITNSLFQ